MSDTPRTDAVVSNDDGGSGYISNLARLSRHLERELTDAHRTIESLRASVRELIGLCEGANAKNAIQRGKDLL